MTRRWSMVVGGVAVTVVAVGAGAMLARRSRGSGWRELGLGDETNDQRSMFEIARTAITDVAKSAASLGAGKVSAAAGSARERTSDLIGSRRSQPSEATEPR